MPKLSYYERVTIKTIFCTRIQILEFIVDGIKQYGIKIYEYAEQLFEEQAYLVNLETSRSANTRHLQ